MVRRRSPLIVLNLNSFFFKLVLKQKNKIFLRNNKNLFFIKRQKLFSKKRAFNFFNVVLVFCRWVYTYANLASAATVFIFNSISPFRFIWFGFLVQRASLLKSINFFLYSFLYFSLKIQRFNSNLWVFNSFFNTSVNLPLFFKKYLFMKYFLITKGVLNYNVLAISNSIIASNVNFYKLLIYYVFTKEKNNIKRVSFNLFLDF